MIIKYRKKSNNSFLYAVLCFLAIVAYGALFPSEGNMWDEFNIVPIIFFLSFTFFFQAFLWYHFKSKGYHWSITIICMPILTLFPIGIVLMYFFLPDKYPVEF